MAKITTQFAFFKTKAAYNTQMSGDGFSDTTIIFIKDTQEIFTHGAKICSMQDIMSLLEADYLQKTGGDINGNVNVTGSINVTQGNVYAEGDIEAGTSLIADYVRINGGTADQILLGNGSTTSLQAIKDTISAIPKFRTVVVNSLPDDAEAKSESAIYLVKSGNDAQNLYTEYIWINGAWEQLGTQKVNLDGYLTTSNLAVEIYDDTENEIYVGLNSGGSSFGDAILPIASPTKAGLMSTTDKTKLDLISWYEGN